jgi:hypothetical protein
MATRGLTLNFWPCRQLNRTTGNCSSIHPTVRIWPPQTTPCSAPSKITWEVTTTRLTRQSRKPWVAGTDLYRRVIYKILQRGQKCVDVDGNFVEK